MGLIEKTYGSFLEYTFTFLNPFKKALINTHCDVHKFINIQALRILKKDNHLDAFKFFTLNISSINKGNHWADQDFKSSSHLYNPHTKKGLFGRMNAMDLAVMYYNKSQKLWLDGHNEKSMFYFGAAVHIIQDMTIPQHANVKLLDNHRQYENFIKKTYENMDSFKATHGTYVLDTVEEYIGFNARMALKIHKKFKNIKENEVRYYKIASCTLPLAQRTTAGCMLTFYKEMVKKNLCDKKD